MLPDTSSLFDPEDMEERLVQVVRELSRGGEGLFFLQWLVGECGALKAEYPSDHVRAAYREGKREMGIRLVMLAQRAGVAGKLFDEVKHG